MVSQNHGGKVTNKGKNKVSEISGTMYLQGA